MSNITPTHPPTTPPQVLRRQAERLSELEALYKEEMLKRKQYWNAMEDMKGKIRVYARVRPVLEGERKAGQASVLHMPDVYTVAHPWKDEKKDRAYEFDRVFGDAEGQEAGEGWGGGGVVWWYGGGGGRDARGGVGFGKG